MGFNHRLPIFILKQQIGNGFQRPFTHFRYLYTQSAYPTMNAPFLTRRNLSK